MEKQYFKSYSPSLGRDMEMQVFGHAGRPVLFVPCQDGRFVDFENYKMTEIWAPWIENGEVMVFSIDTIDLETWSDKNGDPGYRSFRHEQWMHYIISEVVPFAQNMVRSRCGEFADVGMIAFGCSLGATHAANLYFRWPELFTGLLALSGIYTASYGFGSYMDERVYQNSPVDYLRNMPADHPYVERYNQNRGVICVGQGPWEIPETTLCVKDLLQQKGVSLWVDVWGHDVAHDWPWWYKQVPYFVPYLLGK